MAIIQAVGGSSFTNDSNGIDAQRNFDSVIKTLFTHWIFQINMLELAHLFPNRMFYICSGKRGSSDGDLKPY